MNPKDWNRLLDKGLCYNGETNINYEFSKMTKLFGLAYIEYLKAAYKAKEILSDEDFCRLNGSIPIKFLENKIKNSLH